MSETIVKAKSPKAGGKEVEVIVDLGDNLTDAIKKFGEDVVFSNFIASVKITAQSAIRRYVEKGLDDASIQSKLSAWKPGVAAERIADPVASIMSKFNSLTPEEKVAMLKKLSA